MFVGLGNTLDLAMVIVAQDYFFRLAPILTAVPNLWKSYKDIQTGLERIDSFLKMPDVQSGLRGHSNEYALEVKGNFSWGFTNNQKQTTHTIDNYLDLKDIDFKIKRG